MLDIANETIVKQ